MFNYDMEAIGIAEANDHEQILEDAGTEQDEVIQYNKDSDTIEGWPEWKKRIFRRDFLPNADEAAEALKNIPGWTLGGND